VRRFGRNQKRRLREAAALSAKNEAEARAQASLQHQLRVRYEDELRAIERRLTRLLGENTAVLEPRRQAMEREHRELELYLRLEDPHPLMAYAPGMDLDPRSVMHATKRRVLLRQLEARINLVPGPLREAVHLVAEVQAFGSRRTLSRYMASDRGLAIQDGERFAIEAGRELAEHLARCYTTHEGRIVEREEKT
jgi:hypothetical protein